MGVRTKTLSTEGRRLVRRLKTELDLDIPVDAVIHRAFGEWSFYFFSPTTVCHNIGSYYRLRELLRAKKLSLHYCKGTGDIEIQVEA